MIFIRCPQNTAAYPGGELSLYYKAMADGLLLGHAQNCEFGFDPVNLNTGNFYMEQTDGENADLGGSFAVTRSYNSLGAGYSGSFTAVASEDGIVTINPNEIRFSQSSVNGSNEIIDSMKQDGWKGDPIDVVKMPDGGYTTVDNTRVVSAREAGIDVRAVIHNYNEPLPIENIARFTTKKEIPTTWGEAVELRIGKQNSSFRNANPYGSFKMENIK